MYRLFLIFVLSLTFLSADIIKSVEIFQTDNKNIKIEDIKNSKEFKKVTIPFEQKTNKRVFFKVSFNKIIEDNSIVLFINDYNDIKFQKSIDFHSFLSTNYIELNKNIENPPVYIELLNSDGFVSFDLDIQEKKSFLEFKDYLNILFGVSYGILFSVSLIYFAFFIFNRQVVYLFYSISQLSILALLIMATHNENYFINEIEIVFLLFLISSNFFTRYFLGTNKEEPFWDKVLLFSLLIPILEYIFAVLFDIAIDKYFPVNSLLILYFIVALIVLFKGKKEVLFYIFGFGALILSVLSFDFLEDLPDMFILYLVYILPPLGSLILAFALSYQMKEINKQKQEQQRLAIYQNKLASLGEMLANISHQWRQPLTHLSYIFMNIEARYDRDMLEKEYFKKKLDEANTQLTFMSDTIDNFRNFFKSNKKKEEFLLLDIVNDTLKLLDASLSKNGIKTELIADENISMNTYKGDLTQVIFNIINNAKDILISRDIKEAKIIIDIKKQNNNIKISILDNAGGVDKKYLDKIYEPYFTTKEDGLGIGLYMSKMLVQKSLNGSLKVENRKDGAEFCVILFSETIKFIKK